MDLRSGWWTESHYLVALVTGQKLSLLLRSWFLLTQQLKNFTTCQSVSRRGNGYRRRPAGDLRLR
jgi:hypothetical protein